MTITKKNGFKAELKKRWQLYLLLVLPVSYILIFHYLPMAGLIIAFKEFSIRNAFFGGKWVGLKYFNQFITTPMFPNLVRNTLVISIYQLLAGFPIPILLALFLNEVKSNRFKKTVQTITYAPYFISTVVMVSIILQVLNVHTGLVNNIIRVMGGTTIDFMAKPDLFIHIYVWSGVWQSMGFSAIIYIAALSGVDPSQVEAAIIDGAGKVQRVWYIDLPAIKSTIVVLFIMAVGRLMSVGFDKVYLMQNPLNLPVSEIISTFVYKRGLQQLQFSYATAVGLFNSIINFILLMITNTVSRKFGENSLW